MIANMLSFVNKNDTIFVDNICLTNYKNLEEKTHFTKNAMHYLNTWRNCKIEKAAT